MRDSSRRSRSGDLSVVDVFHLFWVEDLVEARCEHLIVALDDLLADNALKIECGADDGVQMLRVLRVDVFREE